MELLREGYPGPRLVQLKSLNNLGKDSQEAKANSSNTAEQENDLQKSNL